MVVYTDSHFGVENTYDDVILDMILAASRAVKLCKLEELDIS